MTKSLTIDTIFCKTKYSSRMPNRRNLLTSIYFEYYNFSFFRSSWFDNPKKHTLIWKRKKFTDFFFFLHRPYPFFLAYFCLHIHTFKPSGVLKSLQINLWERKRRKDRERERKKRNFNRYANKNTIRFHRATATTIFDRLYR